MFNFHETLINRKQCIYYNAEKFTNDSKGWIGGNIPEFFLTQDEFIKKYNREYLFYLSILNPFDNQKMFSIFIPRDVDQLFERNIYPNCSLLMCEHTRSRESTNTDFTNINITKHAISEGKVDVNQTIKSNSYLVKFGGTPDLIQEESYYYKELHANSYGFLFQIDEDGYPNEVDFVKGNYPLCFGAIYIYAKITRDSVKEPCVGYWQYS
jgi:hypothetical protein